MKEIVFAGSGGQGVLTCGLIVADIAASKDMQVTWVPSYGSAMRGGTANCTVKYGSEQIYNPSQEEPNLLLAMNEPSFVKFMPIVAPGGTIVVSDAYDLPADIRTDVKIVRVPCFELATQLHNARGVNIIMTGAIIRLMGDFTGDEACAAMNHMFAKKGKSKFEAANTAAFQAGYNAL